MQADATEGREPKAGRGEARDVPLEVVGDGPELPEELVRAGFRPAVARTPTQSVLRIVSFIMALVGAVALLGGVLVLATDPEVGVPSGDLWTVVTFGVLILVVAGLLLLTAALGLAASNNSARVEPYRFLCYLVGLAVLVAIVWGWGLGTFILFNPVVLATTVVYVLVCSTLADRVKEERDSGVRGETVVRSRHQRALHLLSEVIIVKGVLAAVVVGVLLAALLAYGEGADAVISGRSLTVSDAMIALLLLGAVVAGIDLVVGCLGIRGSNRPERIRPFLVLSSLALLSDLAQVAAALVVRGGISSVGLDVLLDMLFMGACTWLAYKIARQPEGLTGEELEDLLDDGEGAAWP